ncbi:DDE-type integrase/transposase/recombinase [Vibrio sp. TH_r3]|uniref:DDE-type integrase/transposase/recombinase n=1 Tax=Vibrio sp. TH_r3 TaxID=3082084 RepID=UPI002954661C|nr:DDE-type integrase/transposase/recombinase [Vibrio sp. TH_r3]MDV7105383.1 DDE-type integrase/transposase/recombinase [Vibrio sp. TH_r3]
MVKRPTSHRYPAGKRASVISPNILNRQFNPEKLNRYWSGDITYIRIGTGWLYLAVILDLCSRRIFSWAFSDKPNSELTIWVLRLAVKKWQIKGNVIFHSDSNNVTALFHGGNHSLMVHA